MRALVKAAVITIGGVVLRRFLLPSGRQWSWQQAPSKRREPRWHVVTVNPLREELTPDSPLPEPLARLSDTAEVRIRRAAGDRGIELAARLRDGARSPVTAGARRLAGRDPNQAIRAALREAKQVLETGEVLRPDSPPTTQTTMVNKPLQMATRLGRREGRL
ncbi:hypothetical protein [Micromonospora sediminicola]|uniref:hypothetical protein n=1 Tax=Micromonospora sediminicola TaxID=946078 RepID=UPI003791EB0A